MQRFNPNGCQQTKSLMKKSILLALCSLIVFACKKDAPAYSNAGLIGKWELTEFYSSTGGGGSWQSATDATRHTVEFMSDGTFISDGFLYYGATAYTQTDSAVIEFLHAQNNTAVLDYVFELENNNSQLTISPLCIEGCSYRYKAISN